MRAISWAAAGWAAMGLLLLAGCQPANLRNAAPGVPVVQVDSGALAGAREGELAVFRGIPYAAAPVGERRWAAPAPMPAWDGTRAATAFGASCPQPVVPPPFGVEGATSEDCLFLNVWAPQARDAKLPVFVWIHGGAFLIGSGSQPIYDGAQLARRGMVVVTLNYRMGALGFLNHRALAGQAGGSANFGLLDQIAALRWVERNITAFGGDPGNVTLAGESAGGVSVQALMASPLARGLFDKAIIQSGGGLSAMAVSQGPLALAAGDAWAASVGASATASLAELRVLPVDKIAAARFIAFPSVDGAVLARNPAVSFARGEQARVPLLIGANSWEASLAVLDDAYAQLLLGPAYAGLLDSYRALGLDDKAAREQLRTDLYFVQPGRHIAALHAKDNPTWLYHFEMVPASLRALQPGAAHAGELPYLFGTPASMFATWDAKDRAVSADMMARWARFVAVGDPNPRGSRAWAQAGDGRFLRIDATPAMAAPSAQDRKALEVIVATSQPWIATPETP